MGLPLPFSFACVRVAGADPRGWHVTPPLLMIFIILIWGTHWYQQLFSRVKLFKFVTNFFNVYRVMETTLEISGHDNHKFTRFYGWKLPLLRIFWISHWVGTEYAWLNDMSWFTVRLRKRVAMDWALWAVARGVELRWGGRRKEEYKEIPVEHVLYQNRLNALYLYKKKWNIFQLNYRHNYNHTLYLQLHPQMRPLIKGTRSSGGSRILKRGRGAEVDPRLFFWGGGGGEGNMRHAFMIAYSYVNFWIFQYN